jgi:hypothetical protein
VKRGGARAAVEIGFILFLFYTNLLMGEFGPSGMGERKGLLWALSDVLTTQNFRIAILAAAVGYFLWNCSGRIYKQKSQFAPSLDESPVRC